MSRVSHFQRFSQPENHATNNTLLLLRYFYQSSPFKIEKVLASLLDTDLSIGLSFDQQVKGEASTPDALIAQEQLRIYIETKRFGVLDSEQIRRHIKSIAGKTESLRGEGAILIGLTKEPIADSDRKALVLAAQEQGVTFAALTFTQITEALRAQCADFEQELISIVDDYENYLANEGLLEVRNQWLVVFPCGTSIADNARFGLYYEPATRPSKRNYRFIGIYNQKAVSYVGAVQTIAVATFDGGTSSLSEEVGQLTDEQRTRIARVVDETRYYDLKAGSHRFYLVDSFMSTDCRKTSPQGIWGLRYLDLSKLIKNYNSRLEYSTAQLAEALKGTTWQ